MWAHTETETFAVDRWEENKEDFASFAETWRTNEGETARRGREEMKGGEEQRFY